MNSIRLTTFFLAIIALPASAQLSLDRQVNARVQKGKWKGAEEILAKAIAKDTLNPEARFLFAKLYLTASNPDYQLDSAYHYIQAAIHDYQLITPKEKEHLKRFPLDSSLMIRLREKIDSMAFERTKQINTEKSYSDFLAVFVTARQQSAAIELRNEVAFVDALKKNTYDAFSEYISRYPLSIRAGEARKRYDRLLYEDKTHDGTLSAFEDFYNHYPESPYRVEAANNIFEITTASGSPADFSNFISRYPDHPLRQRAQSMLYHLLKEEDDGPAMTLTDSLKNIQLAEKSYWVPVLRNGKFGFIDSEGRETIPPQFDDIKPEYLCGNIREDYLVVQGGILGRSGHWIIKSPVLEATDLGFGFLKINTGQWIEAVHKSGFMLPGCYEDVKLIGRHFIAFRQHLKWGLMALTGKKLEDPLYEDILAVDDHVILARSGKKMIVTVDEVAKLANKGVLPTGRVFDDVQRLATGNYLIRNGSLEGVLNNDLEFVVPMSRQSITKAPKGYLLKQSDQIHLSGISDKLANQEFRSVQFYGNWIRLQQGNDLALYDISKDRMIRRNLDSIRFENKLAFAWKRDTLHVYLKSGAELSFASSTKVTFIKSADSSDYFFVPDKTKKTVFNTGTGRKLFTFDFDATEYLGRGIFLCIVDNKRGLLAENGKILLPASYGAIVRAGPEMVSLLKDKKFGLYSLRTRKLLQAAYERNVLPISSRWLVAFKDGAYGFVDWDAKPLGKFEFEEVRPWNDSSALVRQNFQWTIYSILRQKPLVGRIKDYRFISENNLEKVAIIHQDIHFGIISSKRGEIIPANFSDIINVGSDEEPLYFVEKSVEEAGIYVVIYYDKNGKLLRKQVYENEEYEKIYCAEK